MKAKAHKLIGPGGIKCDCCRPLATVKKTRVFLNRMSRRALKIVDKDSIPD